MTLSLGLRFAAFSHEPSGESGKLCGETGKGPASHRAHQQGVSLALNEHFVPVCWKGQLLGYAKRLRISASK